MQRSFQDVLFSCALDPGDNFLGTPSIVYVDDALPVLVQTPYENNGHTVFTPLSSQAIPFRQLSLVKAFLQQWETLDEPEKVAFPENSELGQKMSIRFLFSGHRPYQHQVNVLRANGRKPTRAQLAELIAREMKRFMDLERQRNNPLQCCGRELTLSDLVLIEVRHVSRGSLQPVIGVMNL